MRGKKTLPKTSRLQVEDGRDTPDVLVALTNQVCVQGETFSVVMIGSVKVTNGVWSR
jgi:hypothetical protein